MLLHYPEAWQLESASVWRLIRARLASAADNSFKIRAGESLGVKGLHPHIPRLRLIYTPPIFLSHKIENCLFLIISLILGLSERLFSGSCAKERRFDAEEFPYMGQ